MIPRQWRTEGGGVGVRRVLRPLPLYPSHPAPEHDIVRNFFNPLLHRRLYRLVRGGETKFLNPQQSVGKSQEFLGMGCL